MIIKIIVTIASATMGFLGLGFAIMMLGAFATMAIKGIGFIF